MPIGSWVDYIAFHARTGRVFATCGDTPEETGGVYVFWESDSGELQALGSIKTEPRGKTGLYVPELNILFVSIPHYGDAEAKILVYAVNRDLQATRTDSSHLDIVFARLMGDGWLTEADLAGLQAEKIASTKHGVEVFR